VSAANQDIVSQLLAKIRAFNATQVPQLNPGIDPKANPANFNDVWTPWEGDANPSACAAPPKPPAYISNVDDISFAPPSSCRVHGWVANEGYTGPSRFVRVRIDANGGGTAFERNATANEPRKVAGPHGFDVALPCKLLEKSGKQTVRVDVLLNATAGAEASFYPLQNSPRCVKSGENVPC